MKNIRVLFLLLFLIVIGILGVRRAWMFLISPKILRAESQIFVIPKGSDASEIAQKLAKEGLVRNALAFRLLLLRNGLDKKIQTGDFRLSATMSAYQVALELTSPLDIWITVLEGWRVEEIGEYLVSKFEIPNSKFEKEEFLVEAKPMEGYLFPDTYLVPKTADVSAIIKILKSNFDRRFDDKMKKEVQKIDLSLKEVVILASIVEREARFDEDRPVVAGILLRRLREGMRLEVDATIQYATGYDEEEDTWWEKNIAKNLELDSFYNTRKYFGFPPTPICNPGLASLKAVVYPRQTDYWYYLSDGRGKIHYAVTLDEHIQNINTYLR
jgi:UPF0755 protein